MVRYTGATTLRAVRRLIPAVRRLIPAVRRLIPAVRRLIEEISFVFGAAFLGLILTLAPFTGPAQNGSLTGSAKFSVDISGKSGQLVRLHAVGLPVGYIASFCTSRVCAPFHVLFALPHSGHESIELQLIESVAGARKPQTVTVAADGARAASIAFSHAAH